MRLIDAQANRDKFMTEVYRVVDSKILTPQGKFNQIMTAYDRIPIAYDVDKVVEELEKAKSINVDVGFGTIYKTIRKDVSIEIVKNGGKSVDVCVWARRKDSIFLYSSCGHRIGAYSDDFVYCPYCRKEMKEKNEYDD